MRIDMDAVRAAAISWRNAEGLGAPEVAKLISKKAGGKPISRQTYENFEAGRAPKVELVYGLARAMGLASTDELLELRLEGALPAAAIPPRPVTVVEALSALGAALKREMPDHLRQDAADLLHKWAMRNGLERHQSEIVGLLESVDVDIAKHGDRLDTDQMQSVTPQQDHTNPQGLGGDQQGGDEWAKRFTPSGGTGPLKGSGGTTDINRNKPKTPGKGRKK